MNDLIKKTSSEILACLTIDDALIKPKYGFLNYEKLLEEMKEHKFFTEIAFIPWNYKRSNPVTIKLLADNPDHYGVCIHGCIHTHSEFGDSNYMNLSNLLSRALWFMEQHKEITGLDYDPVMVFPQGLFSSVAMKALKDKGYRAAFNTTLKAVDKGNIPQDEYLKPASTIYHGFPLFQRRYPQDRSGFKKDIENGRPIIIVDHHGLFKNGYKTITDLVDWINEQGEIKWTSLGKIADYYFSNDCVIDRKHLVPPSNYLYKEWKVYLRRHLSEIRDNYVETKSLLSRLYKVLRDKKLI